MACLDMYNNSDPKPNKGGGVPAHFAAPMSPRISFSNDFAESSALQAASKPGPELTRIKDASSSSSDFEFSVTGYSMMSADELFSKGRLLPFKDTYRHGKKGATTTLREELLAGEEDVEGFDMALRPPKGSTATTRLKGLLGLRKSHAGSKKAEAKVNVPAPDSAHHSPALQEVLDKGGSSCGDADMAM